MNQGGARATGKCPPQHSDPCQQEKRRKLEGFENEKDFGVKFEVLDLVLPSPEPSESTEAPMISNEPSDGLMEAPRPDKELNEDSTDASSSQATEEERRRRKKHKRSTRSRQDRRKSDVDEDSLPEAPRPLNRASSCSEKLRAEKKEPSETSESLQAPEDPKTAMNSLARSTTSSEAIRRPKHSRHASTSSTRDSAKSPPRSRRLQSRRKAQKPLPDTKDSSDAVSATDSAPSPEGPPSIPTSSLSAPSLPTNTPQPEETKIEEGSRSTTTEEKGTLLPLAVSEPLPVTKDASLHPKSQLVTPPSSKLARNMSSRVGSPNADVISEISASRLQNVRQGDSVVLRWQESVMNDESMKLAMLERKKKNLSIQRALSLRSVVSLSKTFAIPKASEKASVREASRLANSVAPLGHRENPPSRQRVRIHQPGVEKVSHALAKMEQILLLGRELQQALGQVGEEFSVDSALSELSSSCHLQLERFLPSFEEATEQMKMKQESIPHVYFVGQIDAEIWLHIFSFLAVKDLSHVAQTCSFWKVLSEHDSLWLPRYQKLNPAPSPKECAFVTHSTKAKSLFSLENGFSSW